MNLFQKRLDFWSDDRNSAVSAIDVVLRQGNLIQAIMNYGSAVGASIMLGLAVWRLSSESPRPYFEEAMEFGLKGVDCVRRAGDLDPEYRFELAGDFDDLVFVEVLLDLPPSPDLAWLCEPPTKVVANPSPPDTSALLDWFLVKALHGGDFESGWDRVMAYVISRQKKQRCVHATYTAYRAILLESRAGNPDAVRSAVREADTQFENRKNDGYFSGGYATSCGGQWNDAGIDFRLAAVLKCAERQGGPPVSSINTIHKWRW